MATLDPHQYRWWAAGLVAALATAGVVALVAWKFNQDAEPPAPPALTGIAPSAASLLRPGRGDAASSANGSNPPSTAANSQSAPDQPPGGPSLNDQQKLAIDSALLNIFNFYLLRGNDGDRNLHAEQLRTYLKAKLPPSAHDEAIQLVQHYLSYMEAHDALLTRQGIVVPAAGTVVPPYFIERIATWVEQRSRLRQTELGPGVAQAWFGEEERQTRQILADLRQKVASAGVATEPDPAESYEIRARNEARAAQLDLDTQEFARNAIHSFSAIEAEEQKFQQHFAQYNRAIDRLGTLDPAQRIEKLDALRPQYMLTDNERERARALGK